MLWVVLNILCFVSLWKISYLFIHGLLKSTYDRCWNLHIQCEYSAHPLLKYVHTIWQELKSTHRMIIEMNLGWIWTQNVGCPCIIVIKHGLLSFVTLMHGWACIDYSPARSMPTHALTFTKHRQPMFNYYNII